LSNVIWSPDQKKIALTNTTEFGVELWVMILETGLVTKLTELKLNANVGDVINWLEDSESMLIKIISPNRKKLLDTNDIVPQGPTISSNFGEKAQNRTYQDLLKNKTDEHNFEQLSTSIIYKISINGNIEKWLDEAMYRTISISPDGNYVMVNEIKKPFSYLVTYSRFPSKTSIYSKKGKLIKTLIDVPLIEELPKGFMSVREGKRNYNWRLDKPASLIYVKALDEGDPSILVDFRDEVFEIAAPFNRAGRTIIKTINRFSGIDWGTENVAIAYDYWWNTRNRKAYLFNPSDFKKQTKIIYDRNYQDVYSDPGIFIKSRNNFNKNVLKIQSGHAFFKWSRIFKRWTISIY
jgi:hypothetical protein